MSNTLEELFAGLCLIGLVLSFIMLVGLAGKVDCDELQTMDFVKQGLKWFVVLIISVIGTIKLNKEEKSIYDRL